MKDMSTIIAALVIAGVVVYAIYNFVQEQKLIKEAEAAGRVVIGRLKNASMQAGTSRSYGTAAYRSSTLDNKARNTVKMVATYEYEVEGKVYTKKITMSSSASARRRSYEAPSEITIYYAEGNPKKCAYKK